MRSTETLQGPLRLASAAIARSLSSSRSITAGSSSRIWNSISARPGMMLGAPGSSAMRPVVQTVRGPHACGKFWPIATQNFGSAQAGVLAERHPRGAGVVLLAGECDAILPDADDRGDDPDLEAATLQPVALL